MSTIAIFLAYLILCWETFTANTRNKSLMRFLKELHVCAVGQTRHGRCFRPLLWQRIKLTFWRFSSHYDGEIVHVTLISCLIAFYLWNLDTVSSWNLRRNLQNNSALCYISIFAWENMCLQRVCVAQVDRVCACAAGALQLCVSRDLLWYSMAPESWPWAVTVCVLTQGHCISPSEGERRFKCAAALCSVNPTARVAPNLLPFQLPPPPPSVCSAWATSTSLRRPRWASSAPHAWPKWSWEWPAGESPTATLSPSPTHAWCWRCSRTGSGSRYGGLLYSASQTPTHQDTTLLTASLTVEGTILQPSSVFYLLMWYFWNNRRRRRSLTLLSRISGAELSCQLDQ